MGAIKRGGGAPYSGEGEGICHKCPSYADATGHNEITRSGVIPVRVGLNLLAHYIITFCFLGKVTQDTCRIK